MEKSEFIRRARDIHGNRYDYSDVPSQVKQEELISIGLDGEVYLQRVKRHLIGKRPELSFRKKTTEEFISEARQIWGDKYDYSLVEYDGAHKPVKIIYDGVLYEQTPISHLGHAPEKRMSRGLFILKSKEKWGEKYDYSQVEFVSMDTKVKIIDRYTGEIYEQTPNCHLRGTPRKIKKKKKSYPKNIIKFQTEDFIRLSKLKWGDVSYNYQDTVFVDWKTPVTFSFQGARVKQFPKRHFREHIIYDNDFGNYESRCDSYNQGFRYGNSERLYRKRLLEVKVADDVEMSYPMYHLGRINGKEGHVPEEFTDRVYGGLYEVVAYPSIDKLRIRCPYHGLSDIQRKGFLMGDGCKKCRTGHDRKRVTDLLDRHSIRYIYDKIITDGHTWMRFDIYLPDKGVLIDCHGPQHTHPVTHYGGIPMFNLLREDYLVKKEYCEDNYRNYVIVRYDKGLSLSELTGL